MINANTVKPAYNGPPIYRKPGQTENKFRNGVISHVKQYFKPENYLTRKRNNFREPFAQITWLRRIILCVIQYIAGINFERDITCTEVLGTINSNLSSTYFFLFTDFYFKLFLHCNPKLSYFLYFVLLKHNPL